MLQYDSNCQKELSDLKQYNKQSTAAVYKIEQACGNKAGAESDASKIGSKSARARPVHNDGREATLHLFKQPADLQVGHLPGQ